jgi:hypothetical protein
MKELRRLLLITAATAGLALSLTGCSKNVDFLQYADVTFDGINGQATATVNVDYNKIGTDVFDKGKTQTDMDEARTETAMMGEVNYEVTPSENLSNGDTVTLSVEISDYFQKEYKVTAKAASKEITVSGLQEPEMVDPFDDSIFTTIFSENPEEGKVSFEIIGTIPELRLNLINDAPEDSPLKNLQYYVDDFDTYKEYSEDDTIALHVKPKAPQDFAKKYALTHDTIEIPVKGAPKYIRSVDEVTQDVLDAVKPIAVARLEDSAGSDYNVHKESVFDADHNEIGFSRENVGEPRWVDVGYMISWRSGEGERNYSSEYNDLFIPYEVEYIDDKTEETGTAVLGFWIKNVIIDENGEVDVDGHAYSITMTAYDSLEAFKKNEVDRYSNEYDIYEFPVNW